MKYLVFLDVELHGVRYPVGQLLVLHGLVIHQEALQLYQQKLGSVFDHGLPRRDLLGVAALTEVLLAQVEQLFAAHLLEAVAQGHVLLDVNLQVHESLFLDARPFAALALGDVRQLPLEHLLHPCLELRQDLFRDDLVYLLPGHLVVQFLIVGAIVIIQDPSTAEVHILFHTSQDLVVVFDEGA